MKNNYFKHSFQNICDLWDCVSVINFGIFSKKPAKIIGQILGVEYPLKDGYYGITFFFFFVFTSWKNVVLRQFVYQQNTSGFSFNSVNVEIQCLELFFFFFRRNRTSLIRRQTRLFKTIFCLWVGILAASNRLPYSIFFFIGFFNFSK